VLSQVEQSLRAAGGQPMRGKAGRQQSMPAEKQSVCSKKQSVCCEKQSVRRGGSWKPLVWVEWDWTELDQALQFTKLEVLERPTGVEPVTCSVVPSRPTGRPLKRNCASLGCISVSAFLLLESQFAGPGSKVTA